MNEKEIKAVAEKATKIADFHNSALHAKRLREALNTRSRVRVVISDDRGNSVEHCFQPSLTLNQGLQEAFQNYEAVQLKFAKEAHDEIGTYFAPTDMGNVTKLD